MKPKITPKFLTPLDVRSLNDEEWELIGDLVYESRILKGTTTIPAGSKTDFASVPKWVPVYAWIKNCGKPAAVVHDHLYRQKVCGKLKADRVFREGLMALKVPVWKRNIMYWAVVAFGWKAYAADKP